MTTWSRAEIAGHVPGMGPADKVLRLRYRIDGVLTDATPPPKQMQLALVSRFKIMSSLDIAERRLPQDGRSTVRLGQREVDLRVSTVPTSFGERCVLRILDKSSGVFGLDELGLWPDDLKRLDSLLNRAHGVIFVTGPTGSGKSTSLYAYLNRINSAEKNVITIEDPIEYQLAGISQIQVASKKGMTFATSLRHVLRQDPDVIMIGEVRDAETARMAIQSSLTGHLVFSTLHTNDSAGAVTRLLDLGVEPYLVSSSLIAIIAQRLVRKICPDCKKPSQPTAQELSELGLGTPQDNQGAKFYVGAGCERCFKTGYRGRTGIYEVMLLGEKIQDLIYKRETAGTIKRLALETGMQTLRMDGARKVLAGMTTVAEVLRVTQADV